MNRRFRYHPSTVHAWNEYSTKRLVDAMHGNAFWSSDRSFRSICGSHRAIRFHKTLRPQHPLSPLLTPSVRSLLYCSIFFVRVICMFCSVLLRVTYRESNQCHTRVAIDLSSSPCTVLLHRHMLCHIRPYFLHLACCVAAAAHFTWRKTGQTRWHSCFLLALAGRRPIRSHEKSA